jgi:hypothetical protein
VNTFKDHWRKFNKKGDFVSKRHEGLGTTIASQSRFVPKSHRSIHKNQKVVGLLRKTSGKTILNSAEIKQIEDEFNIKYTSTTPKKLGNTGISLRFDPVIQKPVLEK